MPSKKEYNEIEYSEFFEALKSGMAQETFSVEEAAEYLKIPVKSVIYYSKRKGELSYIPLGKGVLVFKKSDLDEFLEKKKRIGFI
jgi:excisionase family DNA binding protein